MSFAKGVSSGYLPASGVIVSRAVAEALEEPDFLLRTGYTYSGHPTVAAAVVKNLEIMTDEDLVSRADHIGKKFEEMLHELGIFHFRQIAAFAADDIARINSELREFKGRIEHDDWIGQAKELQYKKYGAA